MAGLAVLAAFLWQWGYLASFDIRLAGVRKEIKLRLKAGVPDGERVHFTFSASEAAALDWVKPDREFRWKDRYYDVVERSVDRSGMVHFACIDDVQETRLFAGLDDMVERSMGARGDRRSMNAAMLALWKIPPPASPAIAAPWRTNDRDHGADADATTLPAHRSLEDPPPRS